MLSFMLFTTIFLLFKFTNFHNVYLNFYQLNLSVSEVKIIITLSIIDNGFLGVLGIHKMERKIYKFKKKNFLFQLIKHKNLRS